MSVAPIPSHIKVGSRFQADDCKGSKGFVRYVGPLNTKGKTVNYVGVEWDVVGRGTHDGVFEGHRYFTCPMGQGSFIHPQRLNVGIALTAAVRDRYQSTLAGDLFVTDGGSQKTVVEFVGQDKVAQQLAHIDQLQTLSACDSFVEYACPFSEELKMFSSCTSLHLENNLLWDWQQVLLVLNSCKLVELNLSSNALSPQTLLDVPSSPKVFDGFGHLRVLYLNHVLGSWECAQALNLAGSLGALEELHLCDNELKELSWKNPAFPSLKLLNFDNNQLSDWQPISQFKHLPNLERLLLNGNQLAAICMSGQTGAFDKLTALSLTENRFASFEIVTQLALFPNLKELRLHDCPLADRLTRSNLTQLIIARLPNLTTINLSTISPKLRDISEKYWMKLCYALMSKSAQDLEERFLLEPSRYEQLLRVHGEPTNWGGHKATGPAGAALSSRMTKITFESPGRDSLVQTVPPSMKIVALKLLCKRIFKLQTKDVSLSLTQDGVVTELDDPMKTVDNFITDASVTVTVRPVLTIHTQT